MTKVTIIKNDDNITNRSGRDIQYDDKYYIIMGNVFSFTSRRSRIFSYLFSESCWSNRIDKLEIIILKNFSRCVSGKFITSSKSLSNRGSTLFRLIDDFASLFSLRPIHKIGRSSTKRLSECNNLTLIYI